MDLLFDNFQILLVIGLALAAWLKNRSDAKEEEQAEQEAREEMVRELQERDERPIERSYPPPTHHDSPSTSSGPPPVPQQKWDTRPQASPPPPPARSESSPPPLKDIFKEVIEAIEPPFAAPQAAPRRDAYDDEPAPWEEFHHQDASQSEIEDRADPMESPMLQRQREMEERLVRIKKEAARYKGTVAGARETQRRLERRGQEEVAAMPGIASVLRDRQQTRRAIVLNEILSKPVGLRNSG